MNTPLPGAKSALALLLAINLFNYIDRQVLSAVLPKIKLDAQMVDIDDKWANTKLGVLTFAFMVSYMVFAPLFGWLDGRGVRRWVILGLGVTAWSFASGGSGLASGYALLLLTRCCVGVGEGAYGPVASAMLADIFPKADRNRVMAWFNMAIPVGSALGFVVGSQVADAFGWRAAFMTTFSGLLLGVLCFLRKEFPRPAPAATGHEPGYKEVLRELVRNRSFMYCCAGMTAVTFVMGGIAAWVPVYVFEREARLVLTADVVKTLRDDPSFRRSDGTPAVPAKITDQLAAATSGDVFTVREFQTKLRATIGDDDYKLHAERIIDAAPAAGSITTGRVGLFFGAILVVSGFTATATGAWLVERLKGRVRGPHLWVSGAGALFALPFFVGLLYVPFPLAWGFVFVAVFGLFLYTGPAFTVIANVTRPDIRGNAFAVNIFIIHALGDAISPIIIGGLADLTSFHTAFLVTSSLVLVGGALWLVGARHEDADTAAVAEPDAAGVGR